MFCLSYVVLLQIQVRFSVQQTWEGVESREPGYLPGCVTLHELESCLERLLKVHGKATKIECPEYLFWMTVILKMVRV